jgi:hypothetical protein
MTDGQFPGLSAIARADGSIAAHADREAGFVVARVTLDPAMRRPNVAFAGNFVAGLTGSAVAADPSRSEVDEKGVASYMNNQQRKAEALRISH